MIKIRKIKKIYTKELLDKLNNRTKEQVRDDLIKSGILDKNGNLIEFEELDDEQSN